MVPKQVIQTLFIHFSVMQNQITKEILDFPAQKKSPKKGAILMIRTAPPDFYHGR